MLKINSQHLQTAMASDHDHVVSYLDLQTGEVLARVEDPANAANMADLRNYKRAPSRYRRITPISANDAQFLRQTWVERQPDGPLRRALARALVAKDPAAAFVRTLQDQPAARAAWQAQEQDDLAYFAYRWLTKESIAAELV